MANFLERVKKLNFKSTNEELEDTFNQAFKDFSGKQLELSIEKIKLIYEIREIRKQAQINRRLVYATWALVFVTLALVIAQVFIKINA